MGGLKSHLLFKRNVDTLLQARGQTRKQLAFFCRCTESWISQIYTDENRGFPLRYLDRIADFFGLEPHQLFQPGISPLTERRSGRDRRSGADRRVSHAAEIRERVPSLAELEQQVRALSPEEYRRWVRRAFGALALIDVPRGDKGPLDRADPDAPPSAPAARTRGTRRLS